MKPVLWVIVVLAAGYIAALLIAKNEESRVAYLAAQDVERNQDSELFRAYSESCREGYGSREGQVFDWEGLYGPEKTSTGYKFQGRADLGNRSKDVTCYFNSAGQVIQAISKNTAKDPQQALQDLANGNY